MAANLSRVVSTTTRVAVTGIGSASLAAAVRPAGIRLFSSSSDEDDVRKEREQDPVEASQSKREEGEEEETEEGDEHVNRETGEVGGPRGPEPTRYGDWEQKGRCSDF